LLYGIGVCGPVSRLIGASILSNALSATIQGIFLGRGPARTGGTIRHILGSSVNNGH